MNTWSRRAFIGAGTIAGGGFLLGVAGFALAPGRHTLVDADAAEKGQLTTWITITPDDIVTILIPHCEMGQGTPTALAMMAAEELDADWSRVRVQEAPALDEYANGYIIRAFNRDAPVASLYPVMCTACVTLSISRKDAYYVGDEYGDDLDSDNNYLYQIGRAHV